MVQLHIVDERVNRDSSSRWASGSLESLPVTNSGTVAKDRQFVLLFRFTLINLLGFALLGASYFQGLIDLVIEADGTRICALIFIVFLYGFGLCSIRVWETSRDLDQVRSSDTLASSKFIDYLKLLRDRSAGSRGVLATALRMRITQRVAVVRHIAGSLVLLGLVGTVLGFIIALSGVDPEQASNIEAVSPMVATLISGMSTALYTTLVGSILNIWLMINYHLLSGGAVRLITTLLELGEQHV